MYLKFLLLLSASLLSSTFLSAQTKEDLLSFHHSFELMEFDLLHVYIDYPQKKMDANLENNYPFEGKKVGLGSLAPLLEKLLEANPNDDFFSVGRYSIHSNTEGLILRVYDKVMRTNSIYNLIYNNKTNSIEQRILLAYDYQAEGGSGAVQSWLLDLNEDKILDVLTRSYYDRYKLQMDSEELEHIHKESTDLNVFEELSFKETTVIHKNLQKSLEQDFPYHSIGSPVLKEKTQKELLKALKKSGLVIPSEKD